MPEAIDNRLDRIENKLDRMADALSALARVEERMSHHQEGLARLGRKLDNHEERLLKLEGVTTKNSVILGMGERMWWIVATAGVGIVSWWTRGSI